MKTTEEMPQPQPFCVQGYVLGKSIVLLDGNGRPQVLEERRAKAGLRFLGLDGPLAGRAGGGSGEPARELRVTGCGLTLLRTLAERDQPITAREVTALLR